MSDLCNASTSEQPFSPYSRELELNHTRNGYTDDILELPVISVKSSVQTYAPEVPRFFSLDDNRNVTDQHEKQPHVVSQDLITYWKRKLEGASPVLQLPSDHPLSSNQLSQQAEYTFEVAASLLEQVQVLSQSKKVMLREILLAAFSTLLYRYSGQDDVLIASPALVQVNGQAEEQSHVPSTNVLILRVDLSGNPSFVDLLERIHNTLKEDSAYGGLPFTQLAQLLSTHHEPDPLQFIQTFFCMQNVLNTSVHGYQEILQLQEKTAVPDGIDIALMLEETSTGLRGRIAYKANRFDVSTITRMAGHYQVLLEGIVTDPFQQLDLLPLLSQAEKQQQLFEWNATDMEYPRDHCIQQLFEEQVARTPDAVAVVFGDQYINYRELNRRANQLAHHLLDLGIGPETLVGVYIRRSVEMIVGLLGILKAGGAYVPLDPAYPDDRLGFMLQDACITVSLTQQQLAENLPGHVTQVICLDSDWQKIAQASDENPDKQSTSENLAYVIYTSGSTGRPKGVAIEHRNSVSFISWALSVFTPDELAGVVASTSICFDLSIFELFVPLSCGGTTVLVENALHIPDLSPSIPLTLLNTVPSVANELVSANRLPGTIRTINLAGEPLSHTLVQRLYHFPFVQRVLNLYGPTEDTTYSTYALMEKEDKEPSIGRPLANSQAYILDIHMQPVPIGVIGDLYLGGAGLARGYLHRPELTAERFIPDPFSVKHGARLYKTGDVARYQSDGTIMFLGRRDHQVKIRGYRIELGEIEEVLRQHPAVHETVVVAWNAPAGNKQLVAYVVPSSGQNPKVDDLHHALQQKLPEYMLPSHFVMLEALPLTANGKLNRRVLPAPDMTPNDETGTFVAPTSLLHHRLAQIWAEILGTQKIGVRDNFFHLGGNSLLAARLVARIEEVFGKKIAFVSLLAGPTIEQLADALQSEEGEASRTPIISIQSGTKQPFFYLHGDWTGGAFYCFTLARAMGPDQPFYAVGPYNCDGLKVLPTFEEMAAIYVTSLRAIQPEGPYLIGGFCNGAMMAYEIARQLTAQGQRVDLLVLVDPGEPGYLRSVRIAIDTIGTLLHWNQEQRVNWFLRIRHINKCLQLSRSKKVKNFEYLDTLDTRLLSMLPPAEVLRKDSVGLFTWVASNYLYQPYSGRMMLFWAKEEKFNGIWRRKKTRETELHVIPGTHVTCLTDHIQTFARKLSQCVIYAHQYAASKR